MELRITFYADPSHGWAEVPHDLMATLGVKGISRYSYRNAENAYLEEDCDLGIFLRKAEEQGHTVKFEEQHTNHDSWVRNLPRY